jgi:hypothetical protein
MVRALIAGTKTQTRRTLSGGALAAHEPEWKAKKINGFWWLLADAVEIGGSIQPSIRIVVGDRLYVREAWRVPAQQDHIPPRDLDRQIIGYEADCGPGQISATGKFRQAMHMPRWASRITLTATDVRVERLQDINEGDAIAEGIVPVQHREGGTIRYSGVSAKFGLAQDTAKAAYAHLWDSINGEDAWAENPWVVAYTFTVQMGNIDQLQQRAA